MRRVVPVLPIDPALLGCDGVAASADDSTKFVVDRGETRLSEVSPHGEATGLREAAVGGLRLCREEIASQDAREPRELGSVT